MSKLGIAAINANQRVVVDRVMAGEYAMSLDAFLHHPVISAAQGAPVASLPLDPVTTIYGSVLFPKGAPSPATGMLLVDFILSKEGQQILAKADYFPARADVALGPADAGGTGKAWAAGEHHHPGGASDREREVTGDLR